MSRFCKKYLFFYILAKHKGKNGNAVKAAKVLKEIEKKYPNDEDWTEEQQERLIEASAVLTQKSLEKADDILNAFEGL